MRWNIVSTKPRLAKKASDAINKLYNERYKHTEIIDGGHEMTVARLGIGHEEVSNQKAVDLYAATWDRFKGIITDLNVKAVTAAAIADLAEAEDARKVIDRRTVASA